MISFALKMAWSFVLLDLLWLLAADRWLRRSGLRSWRWISAVVVFTQLFLIGLFAAGRWTRFRVEGPVARVAIGTGMLWHLIVLPLLICVLVIATVTEISLRVRDRIRRRKAATPAAIPVGEATLTRRQFLAAAAALAPPLATLTLTGIALNQMRDFRIRRLLAPIPGLPRDLEGVTIVNVSDIHAGVFMSERVLRRIVEQTNALKADLLVMTGDLINKELADLPNALDYVRQLAARHGPYLIEGNHDVIDDPLEFRRQVDASGVPLLFNESAELKIRGYPVELLGLQWGIGPDSRFGVGLRETEIHDSARELLRRRSKEAFPIFLAHHPHAFDAASELEIPLTLCGHTHGGQLMLNSRIGAGPVLFRYWSGLYEKGKSRLVVSNGVGNWFPLRINAPAEILHLTLRAV